MKHLIHATCIAAALTASVATQAATPATAHASNRPVARQPAKAQGIWIDVRTPQEFQQGHLQGARNIPVDQIGAQIAGVSPDKNAPIHLYCRSGRRVETARQTLQSMGYTNVTNHGGYEDLIRQGLR